MAKDPCAHCWHYQGGYSNGMGSAGEDREKCCFCGNGRTRPWIAKQDPKHGSHVDERIKVFKE